jgi:hypothetical protein
MAIVLMLIALVSHGVHYVSEEVLFQKYYMHPLQVVGIEGIFGMGIYAVVLPILNICPCPFPQDNACVYAPNH